MKTLDLFEKIIGTLYILAALIPLPFVGPLALRLLSSSGGQYNYFMYGATFLIAAFFFAISSLLTKNVDMGQSKKGRRIRKLLYIVLALIPIIILIMKVVYPQGDFHSGI